jgi:K+-transporting ATPase KdpF subunit
MGTLVVIAGVLALGLLGYLIFALLFPERLS